jgi:glycine/D-amino acid oxidase-like deaminating enzyme/nitrite reductase/ring-hydroxylating ferredoxin subunit
MQSLWLNNMQIPQYEKLQSDINRDVVIIGGGISGILTAYNLAQKGVKSTIIEANKILHGVTANTTAKLTVQQELLYANLSKKYSLNFAKEYYNVQLSALEKYKNLIDNKRIDCELKKTTAYNYTLKDNNDLLKEFAFYEKINAPASFVNYIELLFKINGAIKLDDQYQFHPLKFLVSLLDKLEIYENTKSVKVDIKTNTICTEKYKIKAQKIIIATHFPFIDSRGFYFLKMYQSRSYLCALTNVPKINGIYLDVAPDGLTFRMYKDYLILGGLDHRTGRNEHIDNYAKLNKISNSLFPKSSIEFMWSAQDCITFDRVPYAGEYSHTTKNLYVLTGFNKWGMLNSMACADLVSDIIIGKHNNGEEIFSPLRNRVYKHFGSFLMNTFVNIKGLLSQPLLLPFSTEKSLQRNMGSVVWYKGFKRAVYKDKKGKLYVLKSGCTHLNCQIKWNNSDKVWECPCHGSRFDIYGNVLDSPAYKKLEL